MEDRLADIKREHLPTDSSARDLNPKTDDFLPDFNKKTSHIQFCLNKIKENTKSIISLKDRHTKATLADQEKAISAELEELMQDNNTLCNNLKSDFEALDESVKLAKKNEPKEPETRIKDITTRAMKTKFAEILKESQQAQIEYKAAVKQKMGRQMKNIDPTLSAEQVEDLCNDPQGAEKLMASKIIGVGHLKLKHAVEDIKDKHKDIMKLENSVQVIHQMFVDMALLVTAQGEMVDNIFLNIQQAENYTKKAVFQLDKAKKSHQKSKKLRCCILITLLIIILIIVLVFALR